MRRKETREYNIGCSLNTPWWSRAGYMGHLGGLSVGREYVFLQSGKIIIILHSSDPKHIAVL